LQDAAGLAKWVDKLGEFPRGDANTYAQLALKMNIIQLGDLRDKILEFGEKTAPGTRDAYAKLLNPTAAPTDPGTNTLRAATSTGARR